MANHRWVRTLGKALAVLVISGVAVLAAPAAVGAQTAADCNDVLLGEGGTNLTGYSYCLTAIGSVTPNPDPDCPTAETRVNGYADPYEVIVGSSTTAYGWGFAPATVSECYICSTPQLLGTVTTDAAGNIAAPFTVPLGIAVGQHTLACVGTGASGGSRVMYAAINVVATGTTGTTGALPATGSDPGRYLAAGSALVLLGAAAVAGARRQTRRRTAS